MILDVPIPGLEPWEQMKTDPAVWHFGFHQTPRAHERLIAGREAIYFREVFFNRFARNPGWRNVSIEVIANSGHQVIDEQPAAVAELLERYAARSGR